ncbi:MAG: hypothetical protein AB7U73_12905, partial [Pirellulales bacterium]
MKSVFWQRWLDKYGLSQASRVRPRPSRVEHRRLRAEPLEDRRLLTVGLDPAFSDDGWATATFFSGSADDLGNAVAVQPDGKTVAVGYSSNGSDDDFVIARFNANGSLDTLFS